MSATCTASRPSTTPSASITCHFRWSKFTLGKYVFILKPSKGAEKISNFRTKSTGHFGLIYPPETPFTGGLCRIDFHEAAALFIN
jgi:hypothetical protein